MITRRKFLVGSGAAVVAGYALPSVRTQLAFASPDAPGTGDVLVVVFLRGGADGLSLVPPFSDTTGYQSLRGSGTGNDIAVAPPDEQNQANTAIDLDTVVSGHHFGLHPALTGMKAIWDAGDLAIVHAVGMPASESDSRSHFDSEANWERGTANQAVPTGWVGRHLVTSGPWGDIPGLGYGDFQASLRGEPRAMSMSSIGEFHLAGFDDAGPAEAVMNAFYPDATGSPVTQQGHETLGAVNLVATADPGQYDDNVGLYPTDGPAKYASRALLEIAQLIRADVGLRAACVDIEGWDLHNAMGPVNNIAGPMRQKAQTLSDSVHAFYQDLGSLMDEVTLVTMSEFGRTIGGNGSGGTDHGRGSALFVVSRNANQGIFGDYPSGPLADGPEGDLVVTTDYRTVLTEVLTKRADNAHPDEVFPGYSHPGDLGIVN